MSDDEPSADEPYVDPAILEKWRVLKRETGAEIAGRVSRALQEKGATARTLVDDDIGVITIEIRLPNSTLVRRMYSGVWSDSDGNDMFSDWDPRDPLHHPHPDPVDVVFPS
jgi:hypothetical protein